MSRHAKTLALIETAIDVLSDEIGGGRHVELADGSRGVRQGRQVEQAIGGNDGEAAFAVARLAEREREPDVFAQGDKLAVEGEVVARWKPEKSTFARASMMSGAFMGIADAQRFQDCAQSVPPCSGHTG
jgi:hypothetical protein